MLNLWSRDHQQESSCCQVINEQWHNCCPSHVFNKYYRRAARQWHKKKVKDSTDCDKSCWSNMMVHLTFQLMIYDDNLWNVFARTIDSNDPKIKSASNTHFRYFSNKFSCCDGSQFQFPRLETVMILIHGHHIVKIHADSSRSIVNTEYFQPMWQLKRVFLKFDQYQAQ